MRICVIANAFPARSQTFVVQQVAGLVRAGADLAVYAKNREMEAAEIAETFPVLGELGIMDRVRYFAPKTGTGLGEALELFCTLGGYLIRHPSRLPALGCFLVETRDLAALKILKVADAIGREGYGAFLCQFGPLGNIGLLLNLLNGSRAKVAVMFRGSDLTSYERRHPAVYRLLFRQADVFLPVSSSFKELLTAKGVPAARIEVHHSGIDCSAFAVADGAERSDRDARFTFISVGRFTEKKGFPYVLEAASILRDRGIKFRLRIVGEGPLARILRDLIQERGLEEFAELIPWVPHAKMMAFYAEADAFVSHNIVPANGDTEGIPNVLKEAMATGLPVVATFHGGVADLIEDGINGFLVKEGDTAALADRMEALACRSTVLDDMRAAARRRVEERFDIGALSRRLMMLLEGRG